jgi:hypothetical protein
MKVIRDVRIEDGELRIDGRSVFTHVEKDFKSFAKHLYKHNGIHYPKFYKMSALSKLGFLASELLLRDHDLSETDPASVALLVANSSSSLHTDKIYQDTLESRPSPAVFVYTLPNIMIGEICIRNGFRGEGLFFIQESFDKEFIFDQAEALLVSGQTTLCLAGWIEVNMEGEYLAKLFLLKK